MKKTFALLFSFLFPCVVFAQFTIEGVADRNSPYPNTVTLRVVAQPGFTYTALLNTNTIPVGEFVRIDVPDFYELRVSRTETASGTVSNRLIRFIVEDTSRGDTEIGIPPHVPFPVIQSSASEFTDARIRMLAPQSFPAGFPIPVVMWVVDEQDHALRINGVVHQNTSPFFQVRRGVGSGFLPAVAPGSELNTVLSIAGLTTNVAPSIESNITWTAVSGTLIGTTVWAAGARIQVTAGTIVPAGSSLTIEPGVVVRVNAGVSITNNGTITINGSTGNPVVFMPSTTGVPWGGFVQHANNASFTATGAIFTGSGSEPCWYNGEGCGGSVSGISSHRGEQALVGLSGANCNLTMTDCAAIDLAGQFGHGASGGSYNVRLTRFLAQRGSTAGQYSGANFVVNDSAFIEFPLDSEEFENGDNDSLYLVSGTFNFTNTLFGWTKDDGIDSGGDGAAPLNYQSCWFEATFHEGNSLSGSKNVFSRDTVYVNCGQGIEDGYGGPVARLDHCLFAACKTGVRHGDNYDWTYTGRLTATNNLLLWNHRDLFGFNWAGWTNSSGLFFASNNWITVPNEYYTNNWFWNPAQDGWRLGDFGAGGRVGVGLALHHAPSSLSGFKNGIPLGLSGFCTNEVTVSYTIDANGMPGISGQVVFPQGRLYNYLPVPTNLTGIVRVRLESASNAEITGVTTLFFQNITPPPGEAPVVLSPLASAWKYLDNGTEQGTAWSQLDFNDSAWASGPARLGFGSDPAPIATTLRRYINGSSAPQVTNFYFRRSISVTNPEAFTTLQFRFQRDDGCVIYLNGREMFRNNMPGGTITANTFASSTATDSAAALRFWTNSVPATNLVTGTNVIAATVHQSTATSSDIGWDLELQGLPAPAPDRIKVTTLGGEPVIYWANPAFILEEADVVTGPWRISARTNSPVDFDQTGNRFFRLRR